MKNNSLGLVKVASMKRDNSYKNKSSALHTTMDFGSVMCGKLQRIHPNSSFSLKTRERVLLASLVRPTFGRIDLKGYHYFCPFSDITENYAPMMAQQPVYRGSNSFVPQNIPFVPMKELSLFVLFGAQVTIYEELQASYSGDTYLDLYKVPSDLLFDSALGSLPQDMQDAFSALGIDTGIPSYMSDTTAYRLNIDLLLGSGYSAHSSHLYLSNPTPASFFDFRSNHPDEKKFGSSYVSLPGADYIVPVDVGSKRYTLAFRLSSFGRRLRKNLIGCGWQFNLRSNKPFSILPLIAFYKTYFDVFGLTLYHNYESSYAYKIMRSCDLVPNPCISYSSATGFTRLSMSDFVMFMMTEFGCTYFTDEQDFVSSHTRSTAVSPSQQAFISSINTDVDPANSNQPHVNAAGVSPDERSGLVNPNGHALVDGLYHGQLDSELLMRLYRQTNINTIAGRRIAELLRAQGFGSYVDECKPNFIGSFSLDLDIYDLPSQSDTYNQASDEGKHLGEFGAYGRGSGSQDDVKFSTSEDGYFITLLVVVPYGGYAETVDEDALNIRKYEQYNGEFDSMGYEFNPKLLIQGSLPWSTPISDSSVGSLDDSFGLAPRDFKRKFGRSVLNGDFSLRSVRKSYDSFHLERVLQVGEREVTKSEESDDATRFFSSPLFNPSDLPIAGDVWRYLTRYPWLSRFQRIFYNDSPLSPRLVLDVGFTVQQFEYFSLIDDDFVVHMIFDFPVQDNMLPTQDSFETTDDAHHANGEMSKA